MLEQRQADKSILELETMSRRGLWQAYLPGLELSRYFAREDILRFLSNFLRMEISPGTEAWATYEAWSPSEAPVYLAFPVEESEDLPSTEQVTWVSTVLDNDDLREYAAELGIAAVTACKAGELEPLAQVLVDWHATAEILADEEMMRELREGSDEKGKSWKEIRESLHIR